MNKRRGTTARFGDDNVLRGMSASRTGEVISLNLPLDDPHTSYGRSAFVRTATVHNQFHPIGDGRYMVVNDDEVSLALQGSSHWDSLAHVGISSPDTDAIYHDGATLSETYPEAAASTLGIQALGPGIVTRGVLIDVVAAFGGSLPYLTPEFRISADVVHQCLQRQAVSVEAGDAVLVYTGFQHLKASNGGAYPRETPGLDGSTVAMWTELDILALISDNPAVESQPNDHAVHAGLLVERGMPLGELWALDELVQACRSDDRYDFALVSVPLNIEGAFGSTANAIAIR